MSNNPPSNPNPPSNNPQSINALPPPNMTNLFSALPQGFISVMGQLHFGPNGRLNLAPRQLFPPTIITPPTTPAAPPPPVLTEKHVTTSLSLIIPSSTYGGELTQFAVRGKYGYVVSHHEMSYQDVDLLTVTWRDDGTTLCERVHDLLTSLAFFTSGNSCRSGPRAGYPQSSVVLAFPSSEFAQMNRKLSNSSLGHLWGQLSQPSCYDSLYPFHHTFTVRSEDLDQWLDLYVLLKKDTLVTPALPKLRFIHDTALHHTHLRGYDWFMRLNYMGFSPENTEHHGGFFRLAVNFYSYTTPQDILILFDWMRSCQNVRAERYNEPWNEGFCLYFTEQERKLLQNLPQYKTSVFNSCNCQNHLLLPQLTDDYLGERVYDTEDETVPGFIQFVPFQHIFEFCQLLSLLLLIPHSDNTNGENIDHDDICDSLKDDIQQEKEKEVKYESFTNNDVLLNF